jgi:hypothetical protein
MAVLHLPGIDGQIAIFPQGEIIRVLASRARDIVVVQDGERRHPVEQLAILRKERLEEIYVPRVNLRVPFIGPPTFIAIDGHRLIG